MKLIIVAAHDPNLAIGKDGTLPWYYPEDLKFFKKTTIGSPVLMGRGVFEELNEKPLPGRRNIVLSRTRTYSGTESFPSIQEALEALSGEERSEEHTSELQSRGQLVCRLLLEKKNK